MTLPSPVPRWVFLLACVSTAVFSVAFVSSCTETRVLSRPGLFKAEQLSRPSRVIVYDFDVTYAKVLLDPSIPKQIARGRTPVSEAEQQVALSAADVLARTLVDAILELGLPAERGYGAPVPKQGALVIDGQILRIDEGSRRKRTTVGFGAGKSSLETQVQVYRIGERERWLLTEFQTTTAPADQLQTGGAVVAAGTGDTESDEVVSTPSNGAHDLSGGVKVDAERTAEKTAKVLAELFARQGWIPAPGKRSSSGR